MMKESQHTEENIRRGFARGSYCAAYECENFQRARRINLRADTDESYVAAFVLGYLATYELSEMGAADRAAYEHAYRSDAGRVALALGLLDAHPALDSDGRCCCPECGAYEPHEGGEDGCEFRCGSCDARFHAIGGAK